MKVRVKRTDKAVVVGYTQAYALEVHENLEAKHRPGKQAKYLEEPARLYQQDIARIVASTYRETKDLGLSMLRGALFLLRKSQEIVPVDTGALKASGYVDYEQNKTEAQAQARARAEGLRPVK